RRRPRPGTARSGGTWPRRGLGPVLYLRRETRRAVRRDVRRATLRLPNISFLLLRLGCGGCLHLMQVAGFPGRHEPYPDEIERADEAVADAESARPGNGVPQRHGPVVFQQDQRCRRVVGDVLEHVPLLGVAEDVDALGRCLLRARLGPGLSALFPVDAEPDERADLGAVLDGFGLRQVAEMLDLELPVRILVDGYRVDDTHRVALPQPFEFGDYLSVKVRVIEPEHDELHRSDRHITFLRCSLV